MFVKNFQFSDYKRDQSNNTDCHLESAGKSVVRILEQLKGGAEGEEMNKALKDLARDISSLIILVRELTGGGGGNYC